MEQPEQEGHNGITNQNRDDREYHSRYLNYELGRLNLDLVYERMMETRGITYQELLEMTAKKGDALFSCIDRGMEILDFESLRNLIDPKRIRYVYLNSGKRISIFVEHQTAPYFGAVVVGGIWKLVVKTTKGWKQTEVSL